MLIRVASCTNVRRSHCCRLFPRFIAYCGRLERLQAGTNIRGTDVFLGIVLYSHTIVFKIDNSYTTYRCFKKAFFFSKSYEKHNFNILFETFFIIIIRFAPRKMVYLEIFIRRKVCLFFNRSYKIAKTFCKSFFSYNIQPRQ